MEAEHPEVAEEDWAYAVATQVCRIVVMIVMIDDDNRFL